MTTSMDDRCFHLFPSHQEPGDWERNFYALAPLTHDGSSVEFEHVDDVWIAIAVCKHPQSTEHSPGYWCRVAAVHDATRQSEDLLLFCEQAELFKHNPERRVQQEREHGKKVWVWVRDTPSWREGKVEHDNVEAWKRAVRDRFLRNARQRGENQHLHTALLNLGLKP